MKNWLCVALTDNNITKPRVSIIMMLLGEHRWPRTTKKCPWYEHYLTYISASPLLIIK